MTKLKIVGSDYKSILQHTKHCLSETFSPVKKDAIVRSFLKRFLGADNEHSLPQHIVSKYQSSNEEHQYVICYNELDDGQITGQTFILSSSNRLDDDLITIFKTHFYVDDYIFEKIISSHLIEDFLYENELDDLLLKKQLEAMGKDSLCEWFLSNFKLSDLIDDDFYCNVLKIRSESIKVCAFFSPDNNIFTSYAHETKFYRY